MSFHTELQPGDTVGEYTIEAKIGEGTFGKVYAAVHPVIGKRAAVKVLNPQFATSEEMVSRFISEARAVNQIRHRNIIDIFAFGTLDDGLHYFIMELLDGLTFEDYLDKHGPLTPAQAFPILMDIARALEAAHKKGIAHRDLKPENVFLNVDEDGQIFPKLLDFGIAKLLGDNPAGHRTATGLPLGTPLYMSPEQCKGENVDHRTDVYAFGVIVHEALTGKRPFDGENVMEIMMAQISEEPPPMSSVRPDLPAILNAPVTQMMAKRAADRPESIRAALDMVMSAATSAGIDLGVGGRPSMAEPSSPSLPQPASGQPASTGAFVHQQNLGVVPDAQSVDVPMTAGGGPATAPGPQGSYPHTPGAAPAPGGPSHGMMQAQARAAHQGSTLESPQGPTGASTTGGVISPPAASGGGNTKLFVGIGVALLVVVGLVVAFVGGDDEKKNASRDESAESDDDGGKGEGDDGGAVTIGSVPLPAGATLDEKLDVVIDGTFTTKAQPSLSITWKNAETLRRTLNVKESDDYLVKKAEVRFQDYKTVEESSINGKAEPAETVIKPQANSNFLVSTDDGKTLTIAALGGGTVTPDLTEELESELLNHFQPRPAVFKRPLEEGDTIEPPSDVLGHILGADDHDGEMTFSASKLTFTGTSEKAGRELATFDVETHLAESIDEGDLDADLKGTIELDVKTGWPTAVAVKGPVEGKVTAEGVTLELKGNMTIEASAIITVH